jgi:hypothetical protein
MRPPSLLQAKAIPPQDICQKKKRAASVHLASNPMPCPWAQLWCSSALGRQAPLQDAQQIAAQPKVGAIVTFMLHP